MAIYKQPKRLIKGAVLLMILTIMFVLIIMLMATLTVVSTAQTRTYNKFEQNQAEFTARSCVEYYINNILKNSNNDSAQISQNKDPYFGSLSTSNMTIGRDAELEIRTLKSLDCDGSSSLPSSDPKYVDDNNIAGLYDHTRTTKMSGFSNYLTGPLKYKITLPQASSNLDKYGKLANNGEATIEVYVLDREFDKGSGTTLTDQIANGNRAKDKYTIRIVAKAAFNDFISTVVAIYSTDEDPPIWDNALKTFNATTTNNHLDLLGGRTSRQTATVTQNDSYTYGSSYFVGDYEQKTGAGFYLTSGEAVYIGGNVIADNNNERLFSGWSDLDSTTSGYIRPVAYINGNMTQTTGSGMSIGCGGYDNENKPTYSPYPSNPTYLNALNSEKIDIIVTGNLIINNKTEINGDLYVMGDIIVNANNDGICINGNIYVNGKFNVTNGNLFDGTSIKAGALQFANPGNTIKSYLGASAICYNGTPASFANGITCGSLTLQMVFPTQAQFDSQAGYMEVDLGQYNGASGDIRCIPTRSTEYSDFVAYQSGGTIQRSAPNEWVTATEMAMTSKEGRKTGNYNDKVSDWASATPLSPLTGLSALSAGGYFTLAPGSYPHQNVVIPDGVKVNILANTASGDIEFDDVCIYNQSSYDALGTSSTPLILGTSSYATLKNVSLTKAPSIFMYIEGSGTFKMTNEALFCGYIYAPKVNYQGGAKGKDFSYTFNGISGKRKMLFIGSAVFSNFATQGNNFAITYIKFEPQMEDGKTSLTWKLKYYTRNEESKGQSK